MNAEVMTMKDYVAEFQSKLAEIDADAKVVNIINAGVMNHGKSSLLNSLLDAAAFPVQDIRTTTENKSEHWFDDVYLVDTPGLAAEGSDDAAAYAGYRRANFILFVHKTEVGELHKNEIDAINAIKGFFDSPDFFWSHFSLVLTSLDAYAKNSADLNAIRDKSLADIQTNCGGAGFPVFVVSNTRYQKGRAENKSKLVELSGIPELRAFLQQNIPVWRNENTAIRLASISREKNTFVEMLSAERRNVQKQIDSKTRDIKRRQRDDLNDAKTANGLYFDAKSRYDSESKVLRDMKKELRRRKDAWQSSRAGYDD